MNLNSPLFDRIRVKSKPKQDVPASASTASRCDHPGCAATGEFRAPMGRLREGEYFCFCLDHVREYNASYNYFSGMSDEALASYQRDAAVGHRPTWTMGHIEGARGGWKPGSDDRPRFADPLGMFRSRSSQPTEPQKPRYGIAARKALDQLGLDETADAETIRSRYKNMVKRLHPDANGGDRSLEDKLREIIRAYNYLKSVKLA